MERDILGIPDFVIAKQFGILIPQLTAQVVAPFPSSSHHLSYDDCVEEWPDRSIFVHLVAIVMSCMRVCRK